MKTLFLVLLFAGITCLAQSEKKIMNVAIFIYDKVEILDFAGPGEVFAAAYNNNEHAFNVFTVAITKEPIVSQGFIKIIPQFTINNFPKPDIIVIPGGNGYELEDNPRVQNWIKKCASDADIVMSVCNGALFLAKTGLLDGKEATSHTGALPRLRKTATKTIIHDDVRFVDNGQIITTAGVSAGIDGALHIVRKLIGEDAAIGVAKYMEYDKWNPDEGLIVSK